MDTIASGQKFVDRSRTANALCLRRFPRSDDHPHDGQESVTGDDAFVTRTVRMLITIVLPARLDSPHV